MKKVYLLLLIGIIGLTGCQKQSNDNTNKVIDGHKDNFTKPSQTGGFDFGIDTNEVEKAEELSEFDGSYLYSEFKADDESDVEIQDIVPSELERKAVKILVQDIYNTRGYSTIEVSEQAYDEDTGYEFTTIIYDSSSCWIICYYNGKAYATEDVYGLYLEN